MIKKTLDVLKKRGLSFLLRSARRQIYFRHETIWMCQELATNPIIDAPIAGVQLEFDNPDRVIKWLAETDEPGSNDRDEIAHMKKRGHIFAGMYIDDELIGYRKVGWDKVYVLDYRLELNMPPGVFFSIASYVKEECRNKGLGTFMICAVNEEMKRRGFKFRISHIRSDNEVMLRTAEKSGSQIIGKVLYKRFLGRVHFSQHPQKLIDDYFTAIKERS